MNPSFENLGLVALQLIREEFQEYPKNDQMVFVVYATKPTTNLVEVANIKTRTNDDNPFKEFYKYKDFKYNGVPIITLRVSNTEFEYYMRLL